MYFGIYYSNSVKRQRFCQLNNSIIKKTKYSSVDYLDRLLTSRNDAHTHGYEFFFRCFDYKHTLYVDSSCKRLRGRYSVSLKIESLDSDRILF